MVAGDGWVWTKQSGIIPLSVPEGVDTVASVAINDNGQVVGWVRSTGGNYNAILWNNPTDYVYLGNGWAYDINYDGTVVGEFVPSPGEDHGFTWNLSSGFVDLGDFGTIFARADGINQLNQITGQYAPNESRHAFFLDPSLGLIDVGTLGSGNSMGHRINDRGAVVGWSNYVANSTATHAFVWDTTNGIRDLGVLGGENSGATDINNQDQIVGVFRDQNNNEHIALWELVRTSFSVSGNINLLNFVGDVTTIPVTAELRKHDGGTITQTLNLTNDGSYSLENVSKGEYDITFKASHWLRVTIMNVAVTSDIMSLNVSLTNGDVDGDNDIDSDDLNLQKDANGSRSDSPGWNPNADLDGNGKINGQDMKIIRDNFGQVGDL